MDDDDDEIVTLISNGSSDWPRFMIYHRERDRYWNNGVWRSNRRDGEMWVNTRGTEQSLEEAREFANQYGIEDE